MIESRAVIGSASSVDAGDGDVEIEAENRTHSRVSASSKATVLGGDSDSTSVGVGASLALNVGVHIARAEINDAAILLNPASLSVKATGEHDMESAVIAGSAGDIAVSPAVAINLGVNITRARIGTDDSGNLTVLDSGTGTVEVIASHKNKTKAEGNAAAAGDKAAIGATLAAAVAIDVVDAGIDRDLEIRDPVTDGSVTITAHSNIDNRAEAKASAKGAASKGKSADQESNSKVKGNEAVGNKTQGSGKTFELPSAVDNVDKADDTATDQTSQTGDKNESGSNSAGIAAAIGITVSVATTRATIGNHVSITARGPVLVRALNETDASAKALGTAISKKAKTSVGAAVGANAGVVVTHAGIGNEATVIGDGITVEALTADLNDKGKVTEESSDFIVWGLAAGGGADNGFAGSIGINVVVMDTSAWVGDKADLQSSGSVGSITVKARSDIGLQNLTGGFAFGGKAGVGAAANINVVTGFTTASIGKESEIDASEGITVNATSLVAPSTEVSLFGADLDLDIIEKILPEQDDTDPFFRAYMLLPTNVAAGGGISGKEGNAAVGGGVVANVFVLGTQAFMADKVKVNTRPGLVAVGTDQSVNVKAGSTTWISGGAFGLAVAASQEAKVAFAIGLGANVVVKDTRAWIGSGSTVNAASDFALSAVSDDTLLFLGASLAGTTGKVGIGGTVSVYSLIAITKATINGSTIDVGGDMSLKAVEEIEVLNLGGNIAIGGNAGIGASVNVNVIVNETTASISGSTLDVGGDLEVSATSTSVIRAVAAGAAISKNVGVQITATVNTIVNTTKAFIDSSTVTAGGGVDLSATIEGEIDSIALAGSLAVDVGGSGEGGEGGESAGGGSEGGGESGLAVAVGGAVAVNTIINTVGAYIDKSTLDIAGALALTSSSDNTIWDLATGGAVAVGVGSEGKSGIAVSIGVSVAHNVIVNAVESYIKRSNILTSGNDVIISAVDNATITATAIAVSASIGVSKGDEGSGVALSGGGAGAENIIYSTTNAYIDNSNLGSASNAVGNVDLDAKSTSEILSIVPTVSTAVASGSKTGVGAAIGISLARNIIGAEKNDIVADYTSDDSPTAINTGDTVGFTDGPREGDVYEYVGPSFNRFEHTADSGSVAIKEGDRVSVDEDHAGLADVGIYRYIGDNATLDLSAADYSDSAKWEYFDGLDLSGQDYGDNSAWRRVDLTSSAVEIQAYVKNSSIFSAGDLTADASSTQSIDSIVIAGSVALAGSSKTGDLARISWSSFKVINKLNTGDPNHAFGTI